MRSSKSDSTTAAASQNDSAIASIDPFLHILTIIPYTVLRTPRFRLKLPTITLPSPMTVFSLVILTYFMVVSGIVYDVIVEPPGIGSTQDPRTGAIRPVVFLPGRVNGQYIIEGLSSGFMFVLGGMGIVMLDLAMEKNQSQNQNPNQNRVKASFAGAGVVMVAIAYVMSMLFVSIKIPGYMN